MQICYVPTVSAHNSDCRGLFSMWKQLNHQTGDIFFDFSTCCFVRPQAVAFLAGLARFFEYQGRKVEFRWSTLKPALLTNLNQNGFVRAFSGAGGPWTGNSVPYLAHQDPTPEEFTSYVQQSWLKRGWLAMSDQLVNRVTSAVSEVYVNAFEHSGSPIGIHCCGQYFPKLHSLSLTMLDFGVGIPAKVREFQARSHQEHLSAARCLEWAFQRGASTRIGVNGGLGLDNLTEFIKVNNGSLEIYSHEGHAVLKDGLICYQNCTDYFEGTMVTVRLNCDDRYYALGSELASLDPFKSLAL